MPKSISEAASVCPIAPRGDNNNDKNNNIMQSNEADLTFININCAEHKKTTLKILNHINETLPPNENIVQLTNGTHTKMSGCSNDRIMIKNNNADIESQRTNEPIQRKVTNANPPTASRANLSNIQLRRAPILRYLPWFYSSDETKISVPITSGRRKTSNLVATVLGVTLIAFTIMIAKAVSKSANSDGGSQRNSTMTLPTQTEIDDVFEFSSDAAESDLFGSYSFHFCDQIHEDRELCTVGNCFTGPHCSCEIYFRAVESNSVIGTCDSCQVCDFNGEIAFDCSNLGSSVQQCFSAISDNEEKDDHVDYSPPDGYTERFCSLGLEPSTELCFAGECTTDESCQCDMYKRDVATEKIIGLCDSCSVCRSGGVSTDCTGIGLTKVDCRDDDGEEDPRETDQKTSNKTAPIEYTERFCTQGFDPSTELCFAGECINHEKCNCYMYKREVATGEIIGLCDSCSVCATGGISSDCTNLQLSRVTCRTYDSNVASDSDNSAQLNQEEGHNIAEKLPSEDVVNKTSSDNSDEIDVFSDDDYRCDIPNNGVQLCHAQSCEVSMLDSE